MSNRTKIEAKQNQVFDMVVEFITKDSIDITYHGFYESQPTRVFESLNSTLPIVNKKDIITAMCTSYDPVGGKVYDIRIKNSKKSTTRKTTMNDDDDDQ